MNAATTNEATAILHQGKYRQDAKLSSAIKKTLVINFIKMV